MCLVRVNTQYFSALYGPSAFQRSLKAVNNIAEAPQEDLIELIAACWLLLDGTATPLESPLDGQPVSVIKTFFYHHKQSKLFGFVARPKHQSFQQQRDHQRKHER